MLLHCLSCGPPTSFLSSNSYTSVALAPPHHHRLVLTNRKASIHSSLFTLYSSQIPKKYVLLGKIGLADAARRLGGTKVVSCSSGRTQLNATDDSGADPRPMSLSGMAGIDPFPGKSGSVSFFGLTHQLVEEGKLMSSPHKDGMGSLVWVIGPLALLASLLLPQFIGIAIEAAVKDEALAEILASFSSEIIFYIGLAVFLYITDHVQRPYLEFSPKRWSLITGLKGYLSSAFFIMGFKVFAPLLTAYVAWPIIGLPAVVAVAPFLLGCAAQYVFEMRLDKQASSCWPLLPIIFEVYRLYQLNRGAHFIEKLMFSMRGASMTPHLLEKNNAFVSVVVVLQVLGVVCLWSLATFLMRLFPSRPVAEKY